MGTNETFPTKFKLSTHTHFNAIGICKLKRKTTTAKKIASERERGENKLWIGWKGMCSVTHDVCSLAYAKRLLLFLQCFRFGCSFSFYIYHLKSLVSSGLLFVFSEYNWFSLVVNSKTMTLHKTICQWNGENLRKPKVNNKNLCTSKHLKVLFTFGLAYNRQTRESESEIRTWKILWRRI